MNLLKINKPIGQRLGDNHFSAVITTNLKGLSLAYSSRFDHSAAVASIRKKNREFLTAEGLIDEFGILGVGVLGYEEAAGEQGFLKIGVGELIRDSNAFYTFWHPYPIRTLAINQVIGQSENHLEITQRAALKSGYGYQLNKHYTVIPLSNQLVVRYQLANIGSRDFEVEHYNHNWLNFSGKAPDNQITLKTGFEIPTRPFGFMTGSGKQIGLSTIIDRPVFFPYNMPIAKDQAHVTVYHVRQLHNIRIHADCSLSRFGLYMNNLAVCPEMFIRKKIKAGESATWSVTYDF